jgi:hypothetical protein
MAAVGERQSSSGSGDNEGQEKGRARFFLARPCLVMTLVQRHGENS